MSPHSARGPAAVALELDSLIAELAALTDDLGAEGCRRLLALTRSPNRRVQAHALAAYMAVLQDRPMSIAEFMTIDRRLQ